MRAARQAGPLPPQVDAPRGRVLSETKLRAGGKFRRATRPDRRSRRWFERRSRVTVRRSSYPRAPPPGRDRTGGQRGRWRWRGLCVGLGPSSWSRRSRGVVDMLAEKPRARGALAHPGGSRVAISPSPSRAAGNASALPRPSTPPPREQGFHGDHDEIPRQRAGLGRAACQRRSSSPSASTSTRSRDGSAPTRARTARGTSRAASSPRRSACRACCGSSSVSA
ncbi:hypothetical protein OCOJLMKI_2778 [Methylobacterium iners]|uniref:Uncharacterized protein n=1 Tax=Methylobacterium iners TaxID=418707 RepID=A0ABQ4S1F2_9HYPH|nr:hypothetical protein OCOJLMKI_2778 [Methylobacterium iners]